MTNITTFTDKTFLCNDRAVSKIYQLRKIVNNEVSCENVFDKSDILFRSKLSEISIDGVVSPTFQSLCLAFEPFKVNFNKAGATAQDLLLLQNKINTINAIIGTSTTDADNVVNTVSELLAVFTNFPELPTMLTVLNAKQDKITKTNVICRGKTAQALASNTWNLLRTWVEISDLGNNFNPLTGVFTCVNAGIYSFSTGNASNIPASQYYGMAIRKNGTQLYNDLRYSGIAGIYYCSLAGTIELAVGDTLVSTFFKGGPGGVLDTVSAGNSWFTINQL